VPCEGGHDLATVSSIRNTDPLSGTTCCDSLSSRFPCSMALLLLYSPAVVLLPVLLLALVLFVVVPGGFIIVLGAASWVFMMCMSLLRLAADILLQSTSTSRRRTARAEPVGSTARSPIRRPTAHAVPSVAATPTTLGLRQAAIGQGGGSDAVSRAASS